MSTARIAPLLIATGAATLLALLLLKSSPSPRLALAPSSQPALSPADWPAFHGGGVLTGESPIDLGPPPMRLRWTYHTDDADPARITASAAIVGDTAYVGDLHGDLHAIDLATGRRRWLYHAQEPFETTPLVLGDILYLGDIGGTFHAVRASDGRGLHTFDAAAAIHSSANLLAGRIVFATDKVPGTEEASIYCLDPADFKPLWHWKGGERINSALAIAHAVYSAGCDSLLRALSPADGSQQSSFDLKDLCPGSPAISDGRIVVGTDRGKVVCLDLKLTTCLWTFEGFDNRPMVYASPAIARGLVIVGARDRYVRALGLADGTEKWHFATRGDVDSSPVVAAGRVYVGSRDNHLYVLDLHTGRELWSFAAAKAITASPAIARDVLIVSDEGGSVYCLEPSPLPRP